jgi:hypothetical protein
MKSSTYVISQKHLDEIFHSNEHKFEKNYSFRKVMRIALKFLCLKSILCVSQNTMK